MQSDISHKTHETRSQPQQINPFLHRHALHRLDGIATNAICYGLVDIQKVECDEPID